MWLYITKLYCEPNIVPEEIDMYKEYWLSWNRQQNTWLKWITEKDGCSYINKNERWKSKSTTVYGLDISYKYYEKAERKSNSNILKYQWITQFRDHDFTWLQKYLRPDWKWIEFNLWSSVQANWSATVRRYLEMQPYFFNQISPEEQAYMEELWKENNFKIIWWRWDVTYCDTHNDCTSDNPEEDVSIVEAEIIQTQDDIEFLSAEINNVNDAINSYMIISSDIEEKYNKIIQWYIPSQVFHMSTKVTQWQQNYTYVTKNTQNYNENPYTNYIKISRTERNGQTMVYPALVWLEYKLEWSETVYSTERLEANNLDQVQEIETFLIQKVVERQDLYKNYLTKWNLLLLYSRIQELANDWWWWDWWIQDENLHKDLLNSNLEFFSWMLFDYKYKYDTEFRQNFDTEIERQTDLQISQNELALWRELTQTEIDEIITKSIEWTKNGTIKWTRDYVMQYYDLVKSLSELSFEDVSNWLSTMWTFVKSPIDSITSWYEILKDWLAKTVERLENLWAYEYGYGWWYVWVNLWLIMADPAGKIRNIWWVWKIVTKIDGAILEMIETVLKTKVTKLWQAYITKFHNLTKRDLRLESIRIYEK